MFPILEGCKTAQFLIMRIFEETVKQRAIGRLIWQVDSIINSPRARGWNSGIGRLIYWMAGCSEQSVRLFSARETIRSISGPTGGVSSGVRPGPDMYTMLALIGLLLKDIDKIAMVATDPWPLAILSSVLTMTIMSCTLWRSPWTIIHWWHLPDITTYRFSGSWHSHAWKCQG